MENIKRLLLYAAFFVLITTTFGWIPRIINGRPKGGKLRAPKAPVGVELPPAQWFKSQRLDHFDGSNNKVWSQRYFVNDTFYKPGGPIFVMIGGEGPASPVWMVEGQWVQYYAPMYNAICVQLEHRYYGESHPVKNLSLPNLRYLSSRQALADLAYFITYFRARHDLLNNKLVTFGGSYPGSLSAWFRSKYPYMVDGAVSTSAPIHAQVDFKEYLQVVISSLETTGTMCNSAIQNATQTMTQWWGQPDKRDKLFSMFKLCDRIVDPDNVFDKAGFFTNTAGNFEDVVQYNKDNRAFEGAKGTNITIDTLCYMMTDFTEGSPIERYAKVNSLILETYNQTCLDYKYKKMIDDMKKTSWEDDAAEGGRQWTYQTCAEFGWFQSSDSKQPFSDPLTFAVNYSFYQCMDIFEKEFDGILISENVGDTNRYYGDRNIPVTNVVFVNGAIDPWHAMGVTEDIPGAKAIYMKSTAHCANMYPSTDKDPQELVLARQEIAKLIGTWIS